MKNRIIIFILPILLITFFSCKKQKEVIEVEVTGIIQKKTATTYQYGTHTISNTGISYAIKSDVIDLDNFLNQTKTITGEKVEGYPVDGGPDYLNVTGIK